MASTVPAAKSQPLHNFSLPHLKWKKNQPSSNQQRRRSSAASGAKSHSSDSPVHRQSPLRESVSMSPLGRSPLHDSISSPIHEASPVRGDLVKDSPVRGDYVRQSPIRGGDLVKQSPGRGDSGKRSMRGDLVKQSPVRSDSLKRSPVSDLASEPEVSLKNKAGAIEYRRNHSKNSVPDRVRNTVRVSNPDRVIEKSEKLIDKFEKKVRSSEADMTGNKEKRSKILIKIPFSKKSDEENPQEDDWKIDSSNIDEEIQDEVKTNSAEEEAIIEETKTWNLRPRRLINKSLNMNGGAMKNNGLVIHNGKEQLPSRSLNNRSSEIEANAGVSEKKEKRKFNFSLTLTKEEIEEDIFIMTGSKPARRPKKRPRNVQKQLDNLFPGLWLGSITADSYKVNENPSKGQMH